jgi:flavin-dependent dehydrogenase
LDCAFYDVVIIGAGASGCAAAMSLPNAVSALLLESGSAARERCCGGLLAPDAQKALARLGVQLPAHLRVSPEPRVVHVRDLDSGLWQTYQRNYYNIDRDRFDGWLLELAKKRAQFQSQTRFVGIERERNSLIVRFISRGSNELVRARFVIGADGAHSSIRRKAFPRYPILHTAAAIQLRLATDNPLTAHEVLFSSRHTDFYAWAIPKSNSVLLGSAFSYPRRARARFEEIYTIMRRYLGLSGSVISRSARYLTRPHAPRDLFAGDCRVLLAGEAAGLVSPSSGEGISFALESGLAAGRAVGCASPSSAYAEVFSNLAHRVRRKMTKARVIFSAGLRRLALRIPWCP